VALVRSRQLTIVVGVVILRRTRPNKRRGFEGSLYRSRLCSAQYSALTLLRTPSILCLETFHLQK
jgi:hypothetical protein